jgi:glycosyltransferase involved in cell wall biosynthesis
MISIIIPVYNRPKELKTTLSSVFSQDYADYEVIVVDDGSTEDIASIVHAWGDRVQYIQQKHAGAPAARNRGFSLSKGEYIIFPDADQEMKPHMLSCMKQALDEYQVASYAYSEFKWGWKHIPSVPFDPIRLRQMNYIHTSALIRREHFPGFDESIKKFQDWDLWLTMLERGHTGVYIPEVLFTVMPNGGISKWLPQSVYQIPWHRFGIKIKAIDDYNEAQEVIRKKHNL